MRLTMGGEPTFVSIDNMDGAEWNIAALGPEKRELAERLLDRLRKRFAPGGLAALRAGQMVSGRAAAALGAHLLLARRWRSAVARSRRCWRANRSQDDFGPLEARHFAETLARRLGLDPDYVNPAFEDPFYYLQQERQLPVNVDPVDNQLDDAQERERLRQVFERGLDTPVGFVLRCSASPGRTARSGRPDCGCCAASTCS